MTFLLFQFHILAIYFFFFVQIDLPSCRETITNNLIHFDHAFIADWIAVAAMVHLLIQTVLTLLFKNSTLSGEKKCMKIGRHHPDH